MRHFDHLDQQTRTRLFEREPDQADLTSASEVGAWMGAALYLPGNRASAAADIMRQRRSGTLSVVLDFEDALPDTDVATTTTVVRELLETLDASGEPLPMVFIRMRGPADIAEVGGALGRESRIITGFIFAKFDPFADGASYLEQIGLISERFGRAVFGMPIIESSTFAHRETRVDGLLALKHQLSGETSIAGLRIGGTDLASAFGLRRTAETTVYDIQVVSDAISDIVNILGRADGSALAISAPVWEHFAPRDRVMKPQLRSTPFESRDAVAFREQLVRSGLDTLIREINLDKLNGLSGKTVIHPSHVGLVHAMSVVSGEEFDDALAIIDKERVGGAWGSPSRNKMNEVRPHLGWARQVLLRARVFGVARNGIDFIDFLLALQDAQ